MPGWYIHMDVARRALADLDHNAGASRVFGTDGPTAADVTRIARDNPAYVALGAIGPDIFFLLPDFKPPAGTMLYGAANTIREIYTWWDDNFLGPWDDQMGPIADNFADELGALTGGLSTQLTELASRGIQFLLDTIVVLAVRQYDVFSFLGSGVPAGNDEQVFYWSDMLHYRKTYEFAAYLWKKAKESKNERFEAFALGWMSHLATDVVGHSFVNEKSGGPYRLHWQRHHLVENHMDAKVCDVEHGSESIYNMLSNAAMHLWIAFAPDGSSHNDFFRSQPGPDYPTGDKTPDLLARKAAWDVDSDMPGDLSQFIAEALREVYNPAATGSALPKGQCADHPTIWDSIVPGSAGYVSGEDVADTYWWLYHYIKYTTTDFYKIRRPDPPDVFNFPPFPSPPGSGESDPGPGSSDEGAWHDFLDILLAILAWIIYLAQVVAWPAMVAISAITSLATYPLRELIYEYVELPLYNAWLALHWYLAMTGFTYPLQQEVNPGLNTLGIGVGDAWAAVQASLEDPDGGLQPVAAATEPSGSDVNQAFPIDVVNDPQGYISTAIHAALNNTCGASEAPSEFLRPWQWPARDNENHPVPSEQKLVKASPYRSLQDCTVLLSGMPGNSGARHDYEAAQKEDDTIAASNSHLPHGQTLGDAVDYSGYVVARLTRASLSGREIANFNLDSDRGYGYLCWDWLRSKDLKGVPAAFKNDANKRSYQLPLHPGTGWCRNEATGGLPPADTGSGNGVRIRYIDREDKER